MSRVLRVNRGSGRVTLCPTEVPILLLLALFARAETPDELAARAWEALRLGRVDEAYELTKHQARHHPSLAAVHLAALQRRDGDPFEASRFCVAIVPDVARNWYHHTELLRGCGWELVTHRVSRHRALMAAEALIGADPYDNDARGLLMAAREMDELPSKKWQERTGGTVRQRRRRDFMYLYRYLRPEDGVAIVEYDHLALPESLGTAQVRAGVHGDLYMRGHEVALAGWRTAFTLSPDAVERSPTHQLHGGYRLTIWRKTRLQLDGTWIVGKGTDEAAARFRVERLGLGVWLAESAVVHSPLGTHIAGQVGWTVRFEGQAGAGDPRGMVKLGLQRPIREVVLGVHGQAGLAMRPLGDRWLVRDLPGLEGRGATLSLDGPIYKRIRFESELGALYLRTDVDAAPMLTGNVRLGLSGSW